MGGGRRDWRQHAMERALHGRGLASREPCQRLRDKAHPQRQAFPSLPQASPGSEATGPADVVGHGWGKADGCSGAYSKRVEDADADALALAPPSPRRSVKASALEKRQRELECAGIPARSASSATNAPWCFWPLADDKARSLRSVGFGR